MTSRRSMGYCPLSHASFAIVEVEETHHCAVYPSSTSLRLGCMNVLHELFSSFSDLGVGGGGQKPEQQRKVTQRKRVDADAGSGLARTADSGGCGSRLRRRWGRASTGSGCFGCYCFCGSCLSLFKMRARSRRHTAHRSTQVTLVVETISFVLLFC